MVPESRVEAALRDVCSVNIDQPVFDYLKGLCIDYIPSNPENLSSELYNSLSPFFISMKLPEKAILSFIQDILLPYHQKINENRIKASYSDENPLLVPLENPLVMSEMNWVYLLREKSGLSSFYTSENVSGASSVYAASRLHQQKLNLELLASNKGPSLNFSLVDREKLHKAEMKQRAKQEKRDVADAKKQGDVLNKPLQRQTASSGALEIDEASLLEPLERSRRNRDIRLEKFDISISGKHIITDGHLSLPFGRRIGLIGRNGVGKSTLLRALSSRQLSVPKHVSILHVEQEVIGDDTPAIQSVLHADSIREALLKRERLCNTKLNDANLSASEKDIASAELQKIYAKLEEMESDKAEARYLFCY
jgi:hypothetical protein